MIEVFTNLENMQNELADIVKLFSLCSENITVHHESCDDGTWRDSFTVHIDDEGELTKRVFSRTQISGDRLEIIRQRKRFCKNSLYSLLKEVTGYHPPWGSLTGIRPMRLLYEYIERGHDKNSALEKLCDDFDLSSEKAAVLSSIYDTQTDIYAVPQDAYDVYIGIPFCPTRCAYCSFVSSDMAQGKKHVDAYVNALINEMRAGAYDMDASGRKVRALYIGGGTPTALPQNLFEKMLDAAVDCFGSAAEFTVEAGRPDSIDREKLLAIKSRGATRISINPQTMNDKTLKVIGRNHSAENIITAFATARECGLDHINADIIAALPGEDIGDFERTLEQIDVMRPESLTVHTLAIKRSSALKEDGYAQANADQATLMVSRAADYAKSAGYLPYYLYRQKYMAGNLENVGYCKEDLQCVYNIDIMEETAPILAFGAGAVSKWTYDGNRRIERAPNVKNIEEYIARVDEMIQRKRRLYQAPK